MARQAKSEAVRVAEIAARADAFREVTKLLADPLWSSVLGFIVVHEARKHNLVGPVADDLLYGGIIAINTERSGVAHEAAGVAQSGLNALVGGMETAVKALPALITSAI